MCLHACMDACLFTCLLAWMPACVLALSQASSIACCRCVCDRVWSMLFCWLWCCCFAFILQLCASCACARAAVVLPARSCSVSDLVLVLLLVCDCSLIVCCHMLPVCHGCCWSVVVAAGVSLLLHVCDTCRCIDRICECRMPCNALRMIRVPHVMPWRRLTCPSTAAMLIRRSSYWNMLWTTSL